MTNPASKPRWLTFEEICQELRLPHKIVRRLIRTHRLVGVTNNQPADARHWRILDPSEAYKQALHAQECILSGRHSIDLLRFPVISSVEFAEIAGITQSTVRNLVRRKTITPHKMGRYSLYTVEQLRDFLLLRERREAQERRVRCAAVVRWCLKSLADNPLKSLSAEEVRADDELEGSLRKIMRQREPERGRNLAEFWRRWELAQAVARSIKKAEQAESVYLSEGRASTSASSSPR